ncbi:uncharacterized protein LOC110602548 [Manihot esculenta]|uniref:C2H2-type domain-containing protein n=1 Tax=Manihot esculenta TaxID=3983 RepID=A0A251J5G6_MANES|nr:uncharacterized protein LOC110602548 [Manihot esculenta]XP_021595784.1 uncharacterized protein LOC110602548 [Manihot esculenta]XP_021595785.1 uncharacterized protein LOC110602548 [Manihot esculenta]XP_021595786.1 uncharacterized protein LOC110602548 [Manihot esculenta]XP_021595787.1 uncharacterized protein LOC110602548 [Manihot esculenta]XP_043807124.1 uncharacterized protein LOC110602548 [Manihot esculenta]XP_043807125.1 uncharacterized protein LOC110602548 [Manihot esculenta]XP_04380712
MCSLLVTGKKKAKKHADAHSCFYCKKVFSNHQALGGHLRVHQGEIKSKKGLNSSGFSSNSIEIMGTHLNPLTNLQPENSSEARKSLPFFDKEASQFSFYKSCCLHENSLVNTSKFTSNNLANGKYNLIMSPNLPTTGGSAEIYHPSCLIMAAIPSIRNGTTSSNTFASPLTIGFPSESSFCSGTGEVSRFNSDEFLTWRDAMPFISENALQNLECYDLSKFPYPAFAVMNTFPGVGSNQFPGFGFGIFPWGPCQCLGRKIVGQCDGIDALYCEGNKEPYMSDVPGDAPATNTSKRLKPTFSSLVQTEKPQKELLFFRDLEHSSSGLGVPSDAKEEVQVDLDLTLHL